VFAEAAGMLKNNALQRFFQPCTKSFQLYKNPGKSHRAKIKKDLVM